MDSPIAPAEESTGSRTMADLVGLASERFGDRAAIRHKRDGAWHDVSYAQLADIVSEIGRGLIELGIRPGDRVAILCTTRPEWTYADFAIAAAGGIVVPIYPTNSPEECEWVAGNSGATAMVCENATQVVKIRAVRSRLPHLETILVIDPDGETPRVPEAATDGEAVAEWSPEAGPEVVSLEEVRERGRRLAPDELDARTRAVSPEDPFTITYTSGTTGPPKGCVLTHANYRAVLNMYAAADPHRDDEIVYLYLPLAHSYALLVQLITFDHGATLAYFGGDIKLILAELSEVRPTRLPSVPRIFEKIFTFVTSTSDPHLIRAATEVGMEVRRLREAGREVPDELQAQFDQADERLFKNVRAAFGGRLRQAVSGAAPIAVEILEFFYACGVPVFEGYGMTETSTVATHSSLEHHRFGTVGRALPGQEIRIADDGEVLLRGGNIFRGYHDPQDTSFGAMVDGWLHTGDLGSLDEEGYLRITGRKKDIIITAGGKNLTPANLENDLKRSRWISQAVMYADRRPYPVALIALDPEEIVHFAREHELPEDIPSLAGHPRVRELIQGVLDEVNARYAPVEQIKRFAILDHDLSQGTGELTPTLKVKRGVVYEKYAELLDGLYR